MTVWCAYRGDDLVAVDVTDSPIGMRVDIPTGADTVVAEGPIPASLTIVFHYEYES